MKTICIAGKNSIAVNGLMYIKDHYSAHRIVFLPNPSDTGIDGWQPSFKKFARDNNIEEVTIDQLYEEHKLCFISLEYSEIIAPSRFKSKQLFNIHFSLLPKYKGMYTSVVPIINGETTTGVSLHKIEAGIDTGNIIDQIEFTIEINDTSRSLYYKYLEHSYNLLIKNIDGILFGNYLEACQLSIGASYYSKKYINYSSIAIDLRKTAFEVHNQFRAFTFREYQMPTFSSWQILMTEITDVKSKGKPGSIVFEDEECFSIATIDYNITLYKDYYPLLWESAENGNVIDLRKAIGYLNDIDLKNKCGWTALMIAAYNGRVDVIKELLINGANILSTNYKGTTVLMYAFSNYEKTKNHSLLTFLIKHGADPNTADSNGKSIFDYMKERNWSDLNIFDQE